MIDCKNHTIYCNPDIILRGANDECGLSFTPDVCSVPCLRMLRGSRLEKLKINIQCKIESKFDFGAVLIEEYCVSLRDVTVNLSVTGRNWRLFPAIYLQHLLRVEGFLRINISGDYVAAVGGNNSMKARLEARNAELNIKVKDASGETVYGCLLDVIGESSNFIYENKSIKCNYFTNAYVLIDKRATYSLMLVDAHEKILPWYLDNGKLNLRILKFSYPKIKLNKWKNFFSFLKRN